MAGIFFDSESVYHCVLLLLPLQVIVEKVPKSSIPDIDKKKFLVPADLSGEPLPLSFPLLSLPSPHLSLSSSLLSSCPVSCVYNNSISRISCTVVYIMQCV
jgi:hypothetical protein